MNKEKIKFEFYTEYMDMLVKDNHPITSINGEDAFYYEKLDNKLSDRIRFHEYLYGLLKIAVENYNRTTMKMMKSYMDNNIDRETESIYEHEQLEALYELQVLVDTVLDDFNGTTIIREKSRNHRDSGNGYDERIILKKVLRPIKIYETNTAKVSEPAQSPTESLKLDLNKIQADGDYPTPMFIGDPNMPELEATNGPINCSSTISVLANRPRFDEDV